MNPLKDPGWWWVRRLVVAVAVLVLFGEVSLATMPYPCDCKSVKVEYTTDDLGRLATASQTFRQRTGHWPATGGALEPDGPDACLPYYDRDQPMDPWGRPYYFVTRAGRLEIRSSGDDAILGTDDDIALLVTGAPGTAHTPAAGP